MNHRYEDVSLAVQALLQLPEAPTPLIEGTSFGFRAVGTRPEVESQRSIRHQPIADKRVANEEARYFCNKKPHVQRTSTYTLLPVVSRYSYVCHPRIVSAPPSPLPRQELSSRDSPVASSSVGADERGRFYAGSCLLALPEDEENLSPLHCFMRKHCVEIFSGQDDHIVGLRCRHCKNQHKRAERAVCFPSSLKNIYHSIETWQRRHSVACPHIPAWCKREMATLMRNSRSGAGGRRLYWEESARRIGLVNTSRGIKFSRPPGTVIEVTKPLPLKMSRPSLPIVRPVDMNLDIAGSLYMLLDQMETCYFSDQDRVGGRSKVKICSIGYPGIQCKHCGGKAGFGRYFPLSQSALTSANSDRNIFNHLTKCRKCPSHIRDTLTQLMTKHGSTAKNKRGARKVFFERIWHRMHDVPRTETSDHFRERSKP